MLALALLITVADLRAFADADRRVAEVGRRLAIAGADLCTGYVSNPGWTLADVEQYAPARRGQPDYRELAKAAFGLGSHPTVVYVQPGSPAERAGARPGDGVTGVNGQSVAEGVTGKASRTRLAQIERSVPIRSVRLQRSGQITEVQVIPEQGCPSHFLIGDAPGLRGVSSDGQNVGVSARMLEYVEGSDDELALVLAHELAHNILGHNKGVPSFRASGEDRSGRAKKSREAEADRWALYLMARAGYDVSVAPGFWRRWGPKTSFGIFNAGTHPGWRDRAAAAEAETPRIRAQQAAGQKPVP